MRSGDGPRLDEVHFAGGTCRIIDGDGTPRLEDFGTRMHQPVSVVETLTRQPTELVAALLALVVTPMAAALADRRRRRARPRGAHGVVGRHRDARRRPTSSLSLQRRQRATSALDVCDVHVSLLAATPPVRPRHGHRERNGFCERISVIGPAREARALVRHDAGDLLVGVRALRALEQYTHLVGVVVASVHDVDAKR
jgi:hypothetical protein